MSFCGTWTNAWMKWAVDCPNAIAVIDRNVAVTYGDLYARAVVVAEMLKRHGATAGQRVVIEYSSGCEWIAWVWACDLVGAVWAPCPTSIPIDRRNAWIEAVRPVVRAGDTGVFWGEQHEPAHPDACYLIATSGSTGKPKGVLVGRAGLPNLLEEQRRAFEMARGSMAWWMLSPAFDASVSDVGVALSAGATLVVTEQAVWRKPTSFVREGVRLGVTHIDAPPSWMAHVREVPETLKVVVAGGEVTPPPVLRKWVGKLSWINVYGPTEATVCSSLERRSENDTEPTLGQPLNGVSYRLWSTEYNRWCEPEEAGELWIGGMGVAIGYWDDPNLTAERFINKDGQRWFATRDRVSFCGKKWVFSGRMDRQTKIRGQLINLDEVESTLKHVEGLAEISVWIDGDGHLTAAWDSAHGHDGSTVLRNLKEMSGNKLPAWGVPQRWWQPAWWPRLATGKTHTEALKLMWEDT